MILFQLFYEFMKTGLFAVGGGMATLPFLYSMSERFGWFTSSDVADMLAVSESTPGPIGVNMATYVGFTLKGIPGAVIATAGLVLPSLVVICIVSYFLRAFRDNKYVNSVFYTLRPVSTGLIAAAGVSVIMTCMVDLAAFRGSHLFTDLIDLKALALAAVLVVLMNFVKPLKKLHPVVFIAFSAIVGILFGFAG